MKANKVKAERYIKLGTALRYLIDVKEGEPFGGQHINSNISTVLSLIEDLDFVTTKNQTPYMHFCGIASTFNTLSTTQVSINHEQRENLEYECRRLRTVIFQEAGTMELVKVSEIENGPLVFPPKITGAWVKAVFSWMYHNFGPKDWMKIFGVIIFLFALGMATGKALPEFTFPNVGSLVSGKKEAAPTLTRESIHESAKETVEISKKNKDVAP